MKTVVVIIPVYKDSERLKICLRALEEQTFPRALFEIVVVNNGAEHDIDNVAHDFPEVRFLHESKPGSYAARNTGIRETESEILAFTDADCIPDREWLKQGVQILRSVKNCGLVAGDVKFFCKDPTRPLLAEL